MKIEIICVGALKFPSLESLTRDYLTRIDRFVPTGLTVLKDPPAGDGRRGAERINRQIRDRLRDDDVVIALDERGKQYTSSSFASLIQKKMAYHPGRLVFLIGGFAGLPRELDDRLSMKLSFSRMTIAHDLFRVVFLEQLFRAMTIIRGITYHR